MVTDPARVPEDQPAKATCDRVAPMARSEAARRKGHAKVLDDGTAVHGFRTLLKELSGIVRTVCRRQGAGPDEPTFEILTTPNPNSNGPTGSWRRSPCRR